MNLQFLGHNAWLAGTSSLGPSLAVDPLLLDDFGFGPDRPFLVHPPRRIYRSLVERIGAVLLTHEHSDHVDLASLRMLPRETCVFMGPLMPAWIERAVCELGLRVLRLEFNTTVEVCGLFLRLYPCSPQTAFWEQRVSQFLISSTPTFLDSAFSAVDAVVSDQFLAEITAGAIPAPSAVLVSNNSSVRAGKGSALGSDSRAREWRGHKVTGVSILHELLDVFPAAIPGSPAIVLCGGGFCRRGELLQWPFACQWDLAGIATELTVKQVFGPLPGQRLCLEHRGIRLVDDDANEVSVDQPYAHVAGAPGSVSKLEEAALDSATTGLQGSDDSGLIARCERALSELETAILCSGIADYWWLMRARGIHRPFGFVCEFVRRPCRQGTRYALDMEEAKFVRVRSADADLPVCELAAFGIAVEPQSLLDLVNGRRQIWDLVGDELDSWHPDMPLESPVALLYALFGEQVRGDLASALCS